MMKYYLCEFAFWILKKCKVNYFVYPGEVHQVIVDGLVQQVESKFKEQSGEFKRSQVLRAAMNAFPEAKERELAFAIEISIQKTVNHV